MLSGQTLQGSHAPPKAAGGPCIRFDGITVGLSTFAGCAFDFAKDGKLVLSCNGYHGTITLQSAEPQQPHPLCSTTSEAGSLGVLEDREGVAMDQEDYDIALSQLEQGDSPFAQPPTPSAVSPGGPPNSPGAQKLFNSPSAVRQACKGKLAMDDKLSSRGGGDSLPERHGKNVDSGKQLSALVSPARSVKECISAALDSSTGTAIGKTTTTTTTTTSSSALKNKASTINNNSSSNTVNRTATSPGSPTGGNKRACTSAATQGGGVRVSTTSAVSPEGDAASSSPFARESKPKAKRARRSGIRDEPTGRSAKPSAKRQSRDKENRTADIVMEHDDDEERYTRDGDGAFAADILPVRTAAAAWIASTSPSRPAPLSRSAKAQLLLEDRGSEMDGSVPMGRWGHSATMVSETQMLVLGGQADDDAHQATLGDLHKFDFVTGTWSRPMNCDSIPRAWHTASFIPDKNLLVMFGGERTVDGCPECLDDIMVLDTDIDLLYPPAISGKPPTARSGHSAAIIGTDLIVFGGVRGRKWQNNVAVLDTERWRWRSPTIDGSNPAPRSYHSATVVGKLMVVFGGNNQNESFDKIHVLDTSKSRWVWSCPEVVGAAPAPRTGHSAVLLPDRHTILVHGGWDPEDEGGVKNFGDAFLLDTRLWEWSRGPETLLGMSKAGLRVGHTALLARGEGDKEGGQGREGMGSWKAAFFGGQDGEGVRRSELAVLPL